MCTNDSSNVDIQYLLGYGPEQQLDKQGTFNQREYMIFNPSMVSNCIRDKVWGSITNPFSTFSGAAIAFGEWISDNIDYQTLDPLNWLQNHKLKLY